MFTLLGWGTNSSHELFVWANLLYGANYLCTTCDITWTANYLYGIAPPCATGPDRLAWKSTGMNKNTNPDQPSREVPQFLLSGSGGANYLSIRTICMYYIARELFVYFSAFRTICMFLPANYLCPTLVVSMGGSQFDFRKIKLRIRILKLRMPNSN